MTPFTSLARRIDREEEMDAADLPDGRYARVLSDLARVNALTLAARPTLAFIRRLAAGRTAARPMRILDVGFGEGDMLRRIARLAARQNWPVELVGIDLNHRSIASASKATPRELAIDWRAGDYRDLAGQAWDAVISSLVTHHMADTERHEFLCFMEREAALGWLVNDLERARLPFAGYPLLAGLLMVDPIVRRDGQLSIGRSFRPAEWQTMLANAGIDGATITRWFPWRLCVERIR